MTEKISIDYNDFQSNVSALKSSASNIKSSMETNRTFDNTNIKPLIKDLEHIIKAIELIKKYQGSLHTDIDTLEQIGEKIKENDQKIAEANKIHGTGPQPLRT